ncbi:protein phosphatase CheZ [Zavarzinia sp.]|uniref:protein phosphatase CheZ n=1 Tax=Zavarzinia sp. TaxID=2027920 RepID=UPI0035625FA0
MVATVKMSFKDRLAALAAETGGSIPVADIGRVVAALLDTFEGDQAMPAAPSAPPPAPAAAADPATTRELEDLLAYIHQTQREIAAIQPAELTGEKIPHANDQLRSVVDATEQATGVFLDIAEELSALAETFGGAGAAELQAITTRIYEASNFQDITGQRINKVLETMEIIEARLSRLVAMTGSAAVPTAGPMAPAPVPVVDEHLLNGPQLPDAAATQDDIDRLFASL